MADRTALRLDDDAAADLEFLASIYGTQTAAVKSALAELAKRERLFANMREFVTDTEAQSGSLTEVELEQARSYFR
ncbi:MAG: hypothetical protein ACR2HR_07565 [Euzebya sp.]